MIPRRVAPAPVEEKVPVEMEEIRVTDMDFHFAHCPPLMLTLMAGDYYEKDAREICIIAGGVTSTIQRDKVIYTEERTRTVKRPKKA